MKKRTTRRTLVMGLLSLLLCCSMLVGTTFAWFTDSVTSGQNKIIAGNLDVELYHSDKAVADEKVTEDTLLFDDIELWEPGVVAWENLTIANKGTLALKYKLSVNFDNATATPAGKTLADVLQVAFVEGGVDGTMTREAMIAGIADTDWGKMESFVQEGKLLPKDASHIDDTNKPANVADTKTYGIVIWWEPGSADNDYNMNNENQDKTLSIDLGVTLVATQLEAEDDSFGTDYDKEATYPAVASEKIDGTTATTIQVGEVYVTIPEGVAPGNYTVRVDSKDETVNEQGALVANYEIDLLKDGVKVETQNGVQYGVSIDVGKNRIVEAVTHNGENVASYDYDENTGLVSFVTDSFSPFSVTYYVKYAKVGETVYTSVEEALANWKNNTTLTLLEDITLPDVVTLKSTEHHILNLGTHTLTAAAKKNAIEITPEGAGRAAKSCLTINADATNPGGITATGKACIYYRKTNGIDDRLMVTINGGVFNGSNAISSSSNNGGQACPYYVINGGTFNGNVNLTKAMLKVTGGTFHKMFSCTGDSTAYRMITGGRFKSFTFMTADASNKFVIGSAKGVYDVGVYVDRNNYLVVGGPVITEPGDKFETEPKSYSSWSNYLKYSSANTYKLYYEKAE